MTESHSKSRQQAEIALAKAQSQYLAKNRSAADVNPVTQAREEKTLRLRKARLAKEREDAAKDAAPASRRTVFPKA